MTAENRKSSNTEWLIEKLRVAERERDEVIEHARGLEIDNLRLRMKLEAISSIVGDEVYVEDMFIPDDEFADIDIPEAEGECECRMPSV